MIIDKLAELEKAARRNDNSAAWKANTDLRNVLRNVAPELLEVVCAAKEVAEESWDTSTTEDHHYERMAKMDRLRAAMAALEGK